MIQHIDHPEIADDLLRSVEIAVQSKAEFHIQVIVIKTSSPGPAVDDNYCNGERITFQSVAAARVIDTRYCEVCTVSYVFESYMVQVNESLIE